jgi:RNA polymerase sigma-70 factor (ECF subfamily)
MLRITATNESESILKVCVEGDLTRRSVDQLRGFGALSSRSPLRMRLDLSGLRFADASGAAELRELAAKGAVIAGASSYVTELLAGEDGVAPAQAARPARRAASNDDRPASHASASEDALLARLRDRDEEAFAEVVRSHTGRLLATARRLLRDEEEARDVVQEAFLSAFRSIDSFSGSSKLSTWLHSITTNAALMRMRSRRRHPEAPIDELLPRFDEDGRWTDQPSAWDPPASALETRQLRAAVRRCIDRLPESHRTILLLRDVEDLSTAAAAEQLGVTGTAVKLRLHRARISLRTLLERELAEPRSLRSA